nr:complement factor H-like isoform X2 [Anolis sagrei ordinatus]
MRSWLICIALFLQWTCCISQEITCEPPNIAHGSVRNSKTIYRDGERIQISCNDGYRPADRDDATCTRDGWNTRVECIAIVCRQPQIDNGEIRPKQLLYQYQDPIDTSCEEGYRNTDTSFCTPRGWQPPPACIPKHCEYPRVQNGRVYEWQSSFPKRPGSTINFACNKGFLPEDRNTAIWHLSYCTTRGWEPEPKCFKITCELPNIAHGSVRNSKTIYRDGERIQISCNHGYKPTDRDEATCTRDGWNTRVECIAIVCRQPQIDNGNIRPKQLLYQYQDSIDTSCDEGYRNTETSFCTARGWQPPPACIPKRCEYPRVQNGRVYEWQYYFPKKPGSTINFSCDNGFLPEDRNTATWHLSYCTTRGWEPEPKCFKQCDRPRRIPHGALNDYQWPLIEGNEISYRCDTGYVPANQQTTITCTKDGWLPIPSCVAEIPRGCQKTPLPNGFFTAHKEVFSVSEKVRYKCLDGYTTPNRVEEEEIQCLQTGWNQEPKCIKTCQKPYGANVDFDENQSFFLSQETLHYKCKEGFQVSKTAVDGHIQCTENGWDSVPVCVAIECDVPILGNGNIEGKEQFANGDVVKFSCKKGYSRVGPDSAQCYYFGWSPLPPVCKETVKSCQQPPSISNGTVAGDLLDEYQHGEKLFYECDIGFVMSGSNTVECVDGEWTSLPSCTEKCKRPTDIKFGPSVSRSMYFDNNTVISYSCGVSLHETKCVNGKWFPEPECTELCPPPPQLPNAINIIETRNYKNGEEVGFTCMKHFLLQGPPKIPCEYGRWQTPPRCIDQRCENPPSIDNGEVEIISQNKYIPGQTVEYHCLEGFEISGSSFAICENAKWHHVPACKEKTCGQPPLIDYASFTKNVKNRYQSGETVNYECHPGFAAEGPLILTCQRGEWSEPSTCEDITCGEPPVVANGDIVVNRDNIYLPGQILHYQCQKDFETIGPNTIRCENQAWSEPPTCEDVRCPPPPDILHGRLQGNVKQKYSPNESVMYQCDHGYVIFGSHIITCLKKQWSEAPQCRVYTGKCSRPPSIENGDIIDLLKQEYKSGESVTYKCQRFYAMEGTAVVSCQDGHWSEPPECKVPCTASEEDMERNNIRLKWSRAEKLYSQDGDITEFICRRGYSPVVPLSQFRVRCVNGAFEYPLCE